MTRMFYVIKLAECFNGTKISYMPKDHSKFDFSCHDPFMINVLLLVGTSSLYIAPLRFGIPSSSPSSRTFPNPISHFAFCLHTVCPILIKAKNTKNKSLKVIIANKLSLQLALLVWTSLNSHPAGLHGEGSGSLGHHEPGGRGRDLASVSAFWGNQIHRGAHGRGAAAPPRNPSRPRVKAKS